jgi:hypothetical protein
MGDYRPEHVRKGKSRLLLMYLSPYSPDLLPTLSNCGAMVEATVGLWTPSWSKMPVAFSTTAVTVHRPSLHDRRSNGGGYRFHALLTDRGAEQLELAGAWYEICTYALGPIA